MIDFKLLQKLRSNLFQMMALVILSTGIFGENMYSYWLSMMSFLGNFSSRSQIYVL